MTASMAAACPNTVETCSTEAGGWFALYVLPRHEKSVKKILDSKGYLTSLPLRRCYYTRSSGSHWESEKPLISGYVFIASEPAPPHAENLARIVTTPGVIQAVGYGTKANAIPSSEIQALERIAASQLPIAHCAYTRIGDGVQLIRGPLRGVRGKVISESGAARLMVSIDLLQRSLTIEIENTWAQPL